MTDIFLDIQSVPVDTNVPTDVVDVEDSLKQNRNVDPCSSLQTFTSEILPTHYVLPFGRTIKLGTQGNDVKGVKRAIWRANGLNVPFGSTSLFGPIAVQLLKRFQTKHRLQVDGVVGPETLKALGSFFDAYAFFLYEGYAPGTNPRLVQEKAFIAYALWGYNSRGSIHYLQSRPMNYMNDLKHLPVWEDCSAFFTKCCKFAGFKDPNGFGYNGAGYTGTIAAHGTRLSDISQAKPGAAVLYGSPPGYEHVAAYIGGGRIVSHGSEGGPYFLPYDYRSVTAIRQF